MARAVDEQAQAQQDVERIAKGYYEMAQAIHREIHRGMLPTWQQLSETERGIYRECTRRLLKADVIRVGARPSVERPMEGQVSIKDNCLHVWKFGDDFCANGCGARYSELYPEAVDGR